jgi:hypothetical protein
VLTDVFAERDMFIATMMVKVGLCVESAELLCDWLISVGDDDYDDITATDVEAWFNEMMQLSENGMATHYGQVVMTIR